ncbi:MAG: hypothetical protein KGO96_10130 [Elusimicrobia bacterium]|nr:hypothetical protein [Elusimicrobiota bacterium]
MPFDPDIDDGLVLIGSELLTPEEVTRRAQRRFPYYGRKKLNAGQGTTRAALLARYHLSYRDPVSGFFDPTAPSFAEFIAPHKR